jgi:hypothetical protein
VLSSKIFGNDSGEDEKLDVLSSYFVDLPKFAEFYDAENPLMIVRARKGMGKSALIAHLYNKIYKTENELVIKVRGNELLGMSDFTGKGPAYLENLWIRVICQRICVEIGSKLGFAGSDLKMSLVELAEIDGYKDKNIVSALTDRVGGLIKLAIGKGDLVNADVTGMPAKKGIQNPLGALLRFQEQAEHGGVWFLVDDIDAKYKDNEHYRDLVGAFFSAVRALSFSVKNLKIRASVRTDVWFDLRFTEDQDKIRQYVIDINWTDAHLKEILAKKVLSYFQRTTSDAIIARYDVVRNYNEIMDLVFQKTFPWGDVKVEPFIPIKTFAGSRPRWMGQLCRLASFHAHNRISIDNVKDSMDAFGTEKISDLEKEHAHQFTDIKKLIESFRAGGREYNLFALRKRIEDRYIKKVGAVPDVDGYPYRDSNQLARLLFKIEVLTGRRKSEKNGFVMFENDPNFFDLQENSDNLIMWVINPSYRKYLRIE